MLRRALSTAALLERNCDAVQEMTAACKSLERRYERELDTDLPFVIRLDGVNFKRLTSTLHKPFDARFTNAMLRTARDLLEAFSATTVFVQSDEVSLFVLPKFGAIPYNGRCQKISSVAAGIASVRFNGHIEDLHGDGRRSMGSFDARCFSCPSEEALVQVAAWRHLHDCRRNAVNSAASANFTHCSLQGQPVELVVERLLKERQISFHNDYPKEAIFGAFLKKIPVQHQGHNPLTKHTVMTTRHKIHARAIDFGVYPKEVFAQVLLSRYWEPDHPLGHHVPLLP